MQPELTDVELFPAKDNSLGLLFDKSPYYHQGTLFPVHCFRLLMSVARPLGAIWLIRINNCG